MPRHPPPRRLSDSYRFTGFRPEQTVVGVFGDPNAQVTETRSALKYELMDLPDNGWARPGLFRGQRWALPSIEHLCSLMREVHTNREIGRRIGKRARAEIFDCDDRRRIALMMKERIAALARNPG